MIVDSPREPYRLPGKVFEEDFKMKNNVLRKEEPSHNNDYVNG